MRARKDGYREVSHAFTVNANGEQTISLALEAETRMAKVVIHAPHGSTIWIDGRALGHGGTPFLRELPRGAHTVRVLSETARPFERKITLEENDVHTIDVELESRSKRLVPLDVLVGCAVPKPVAFDDGLMLHLDGSETPEGPSSSSEGRAVRYLVQPGRHAVSVRVPGCAPLDKEIRVAEEVGSELTGVLPGEASITERPPLGVPDGWRLGLALWRPYSLGAYGTVRIDGKDASDSYEVSGLGVAAQVGIVNRWLVGLADLGFAEHEVGARSLEQPRGLPLPRAQWARAMARAGARLPLQYLTFSIGPSLGLEVVNVTGEPPNIAFDRTTTPLAGAWTMTELQPFCDVGAFVLFDLAFVAEASTAVGFGLHYQPSKRCRAEHDADIGLKAAPRRPR